MSAHMNVSLYNNLVGLLRLVQLPVEQVNTLLDLTNLQTQVPLVSKYVDLDTCLLLDTQVALYTFC